MIRKRFNVWLYNQFTKLIGWLPKSKSVLYIIKYDALGDYFFLRDNVSNLRQLFPDCHLVFVANEAHKELILKDGCFDDYVFITPKTAFRSGCHWQLYRKILKHRGSRLISFMFSPEHFRNLSHVVHLTRCKESYCGFIPNRELEPGKIQNSLLEIFTHPFELTESVAFESFRYREFIEKAFTFNCELQLQPISSARDLLDDEPKFDVTLVVGAGREERDWGMRNFEETIKRLDKARLQLRLSVVGVSRETSIVEQWQERFPTIDIAINNLTVTEFISWLARSKMVLCNESAAAHICARLGIPFVCISNLNHYYRFHPYPDRFKVCQCYIYPETQATDDELARQTRYRSPFSLKDISVEEVTSAVLGALE